jgi:hypothetical protein
MPPVLSGLLADFLVIVHFAFVVFVAGGALLVLRWRRLAWVHVPAAIWGVFIEASGGICPLTPLEQSLRTAAGESPYTGDFVTQYLVPVLYPPDLTRHVQWALALVVVVTNVVIYGVLLTRRRSAPCAARRSRGGTSNRNEQP